MTILCVFAVLNPLVVQAGFLLAPPAEEGGLSISQVFQGVAFLVGAVMVLLSRWTPNVHSSRLGRLLVLAMVCTAVFLGKSILESPDLPIMAFRGDAVFYFKIVFWCSSWFMIAILVRSESDATCLLRAMTLGAFLTAVIVVICFATGAGTIEVYAREGVRASVGVSGVSAKPTVPFLAAGAFIVVYLFGRARRLAGLVAAAVLLTATLVSYDRAVQVGLVAALVWFCVWRFALSARGRVGPAERIVIVGGLAGVLLFGSLGYQSLQKRWTADFEKGRPGSGRLGFYLAASERFAEGPPADVILGIGYSGIKQTMQERCDMAVHTHSDLFDLLLGGGLLGLGFYGAVFWSLGVYFRGVPVPSEEFVVMGAVGAVYVVMSLITGLLEATHAMFCLGVVFHCCHVRAVSRAEATRPADRKDSNRGD